MAPVGRLFFSGMLKLFKRCWYTAGAPLWGRLFALAVLVVVTLALVPSATLPATLFDWWDKAQHVTAFAVLVLLGRQAYPSHGGRVAMGLVLLGAGIELAQAWVGWRDGDVLDWLADGVGVVLASGVFSLWRCRARMRWPAS